MNMNEILRRDLIGIINECRRVMEQAELELAVLCGQPPGLKLSEPADPCLCCQYSTQSCAYILGGKKPEDACVTKRIWLRPFNNPRLSAAPLSQYGKRKFEVSEKQLYALMQGWTHTDLIDEKPILQTICDQPCICPHTPAPSTIPDKSEYDMIMQQIADEAARTATLAAIKPFEELADSLHDVESFVIRMAIKEIIVSLRQQAGEQR